MYIKATPSLGYSSYNNPRNVTRACFQSLAHVQFGQMVQNSVVSVILGKFGYLQVQSLSYAPYHTKDIEIVLLIHIEDVRFLTKFVELKRCMCDKCHCKTTNMFRCFLGHSCCSAHYCWQPNCESYSINMY